jgi:uroporphyrin-III C-methyltransferase/precorrin-2 dehydrogenase/sirohydrochlorin ferrochelatase
MHHFPLFARIAGEPCLVVGGGVVALRKVRMLRQAGARVTVNAPVICAELHELAEAGALSLEQREFDPSLIDRHLLVIAATSRREVNHAVASAARAAFRLCNVVDDGAASSYISPAVVDRSPLLIAVSSGGSAPVLARRLRQQLETLLPARLGTLASWAQGWRERVQARLPDIDRRRRFWEDTLAGAAARHVLAGREAAADELASTTLDGTARQAQAGEAWLVGAGPGDPELLTLAGLKLLQEAEVILHDRLVSPEILALARRDAEFIDVGKTGGGPSTSQQAINRTLVGLVRAGKRVCRLKGGDPYIFGRGGEEALALAEAGLPFRVVPGITAASGCAAYAGIPLTHRKLADGVSFVTARLSPGSGEPDWERLAGLDHTLAIYMPVQRLDDITKGLIRHGRPAQTPAALVEHGTTARQRRISGTLANIAQHAVAGQVGSPALLLVGEVVELAPQLGWWQPDASTTARQPLSAAAAADASINIAPASPAAAIAPTPAQYELAMESQP